MIQSARRAQSQHESENQDWRGCTEHIFSLNCSVDYSMATTAG